MTVESSDDPAIHLKLWSIMRWRALLIGLLLAVLTWAVFGQVRGFEFVDFDDRGYVYENPHVSDGLTAASVRWAFSQEAVSQSANWHPLTWLSLMLDTELFGTDPGGYHLTSVVLHTANTLLLFLLMIEMTGAVWKSGVVAALFAIHPLHVESVAWISERKDVLSTLFGLLAMVAYVRYTCRSGKGWYAASLVAFMLSLLAKQTLVTLPFLLLLLDAWPLRRTRWEATQKPLAGSEDHLGEEKPPIETQSSSDDCGESWQRLVGEKLPYFAITIAFSAIAMSSQGRGQAMASWEEFPLSYRLGNATVVMVLYLVKMIWPQNLACYYPLPGAIPPLQVAGALLLLVVVTVGVLWQWRRHPALPVGWFWYLGTLVPVVGLVQIGGQRMADRYTYVPLIGIFMAITWAVPLLFPKGWSRRVLLPSLTIAILFALSAAAWRQTGYWRNSVTLFKHSLSIADSDLIRNSLGTVLQSQDKTDQAMQQYRRALEIEPRNVMSHFNLGILLTAEGEIEAAIEHYQAAIRFNPEHLGSRINLGNLLCEQGRFTEAEEILRPAVQDNPESAIAHGNLGFALLGQGRFEEARQSFAQSARLDPRLAVTDEVLAERHLQAGETLAAQGNLEGAIPQFRQAVTHSPDNAAALYDLALALLSSAQWQEAETFYRRLLAIRPEIPEGHNGLGVALMQQGKAEAAMAHFREAVRLDPELSAARENLQQALGE